MEITHYMETHSVNPAYNLAFEEYVLQNFPHGNILILWQNAPSVIIGRNQNTSEEINAYFLNEHHIHVVRRNTGGGAVYHDLGNLNYSFITNGNCLGENTLTPFLEPVVRALQSLGLDANATGRNDILISGKKISGTAQQFHKGRILHHGTLLFDSDLNVIGNALKPDATKFQSKSVKSVRNRVGNIRDFLTDDMELTAFWTYLKKYLTSEHTELLELSATDKEKIKKLQEEKYESWDWNYGKSPNCQMAFRNRFSGGLLDIRLSAENQIITQLQIRGDFLAISPITELENTLIGCPYLPEGLNKALDTLPLSQYLGNITREEFIKTLLGET